MSNFYSFLNKLDKKFYKDAVSIYFFNENYFEGIMEMMLYGIQQYLKISLSLIRVI